MVWKLRRQEYTELSILHFSASKIVAHHEMFPLTSMNVTLLWTRRVRTQPLTTNVCPSLSSPSSRPPFISEILSFFLNSPTFSPCETFQSLETSGFVFSTASPAETAVWKFRRKPEEWRREIGGKRMCCGSFLGNPVMKRRVEQGLKPREVAGDIAAAIEEGFL